MKDHQLVQRHLYLQNVPKLFVWYWDLAVQYPLNNLQLTIPKKEMSVILDPIFITNYKFSWNICDALRDLVPLVQFFIKPWKTTTEEWYF